VDAYIISRTAMKLNRENMRGWGGKTTELKALLIGQVAVILSSLVHLPLSWVVSLLAVNAGIYMVSRGLVKHLPPPQKVHHQVINL
jgi:hypothetical protein